MAKVDRRILKTQEAITKALVELMSAKNFDDITIQDISDKANVNRGTLYLHYTDKFDLLDKLIEIHISNLRNLCASAVDLEIDVPLKWLEYFESNYLFFSTMLASKGALSFRHRFLDLLLEASPTAVTLQEEKNAGLHKDIIVQFFGSAWIGVIEWWVANGMPFPPRVMAKQMELLLARNL